MALGPTTMHRPWLRAEMDEPHEHRPHRAAAEDGLPRLTVLKRSEGHPNGLIRANHPIMPTPV